MQKGNFWRNSLIILGLFVALGTLRAQVQVPVLVSYLELDPDPVSITAGDAVYWVDADWNGPYIIYGPSHEFWTYTTDGPTNDVFAVVFNQPGTYRYYCRYDEYTEGPGTIVVQAPNVPPTVTITSPTNNAVFQALASFSFTASASDPDSGFIAYVAFYVGPNVVDYVISPPFTTSVTNLAAGNYTLTAVAYDGAYASATNSVSITVTGVPPALIAKRFGNQMVISWDTNNATGLALQSTTNLTSSSTWKAVTTTPALVGSQMMVTNPIVGTKQFFRLSNQ